MGVCLGYYGAYLGLIAVSFPCLICLTRTFLAYNSFIFTFFFILFSCAYCTFWCHGRFHITLVYLFLGAQFVIKVNAARIAEQLVALLQFLHVTFTVLLCIQEYSDWGWELQLLNAIIAFVMLLTTIYCHLYHCSEWGGYLYLCLLVSSNIRYVHWKLGVKSRCRRYIFEFSPLTSAISGTNMEDTCAANFWWSLGGQYES